MFAGRRERMLPLKDMRRIIGSTTRLPHQSQSQRHHHYHQLRLLVVLFALLALLSGLLTAGAGGRTQGQSDYVDGADKHPVFFSEYKLRNTIVAANSELRQLKRDLMRQMGTIYAGLKSDPVIGFEMAKLGKPAGVASSLLAEQFATIVIKKHIIERRLLAGLRVAFVKFLPVGTLRRLADRFEPYAWLKGQNQVDLRPKFLDAKESQYNHLYELISLRARARAADDALALTSDNIKRILKTIEWFLIERKATEDVLPAELAQMSQHARKILAFYTEHIVAEHRKAREAYQASMAHASGLTQLVGGRDEFLRFVDQLIDSEALDIGLSQEAGSLELPPTISQSMIENIEQKWIPGAVLRSIDDDRSVLLKHRAQIRHLVRLDPVEDSADVDLWCSNAALFISKDRSSSTARRL